VTLSLINREQGGVNDISKTTELEVGKKWQSAAAARVGLSTDLLVSSSHVKQLQNKMMMMMPRNAVSSYS